MRRFGARSPLATGALCRAALLVAVGGLVANCGGPPRGVATGGSGVDPRYGVKPSPRVVAEGEPVPKGGGREMIGQPYTVGGRTYVPREDKRYSRQGLASWYGAAFHGRLTANGEVFDRESIAAAHPTMPLPSYARVTNLANGRSLVVRVNDRGPYHENRLIDVSQRAAEALGFHRVGTSQVRVDYVGRASLKGSDDARLMATLRTDGRAGAAPSLMAAADLGPPPPSRAPAAPSTQTAAPTRASTPVQVARAAAEAESESDESEAPDPAPVRAEPTPRRVADQAPLPPGRPLALAAASSPDRPAGRGDAPLRPRTTLSYAAVETSRESMRAGAR